MNKEMEDIKEIIRVMPLIGKTPDIIDGYMEGDIINIIELLAKHNFNYYFEYICKCISESTLQSYRNINSYILSKNNNENLFTKYHIKILTKYK